MNSTKRKANKILKKNKRTPLKTTEKKDSVIRDKVKSKVNFTKKVEKYYNMENLPESDPSALKKLKRSSKGSEEAIEEMAKDVARFYRKRQKKSGQKKSLREMQRSYQNEPDKSYPKHFRYNPPKK